MRKISYFYFYFAYLSTVVLSHSWSADPLMIAVSGGEHRPEVRGGGTVDYHFERISEYN